MSEEQKQPEEKAKTQEKTKNKKSVDIGMFKEALINYIVPLIAVSASIFVGIFILLPSYNELPELELELEKQTNLEKDLRNKLGNLNDLVDFSGIVEENSDLVNKVLVSEELVPGLLTQIDRIASESGLSVNRLNYGIGSAKGSEEGTGGEVSYNVVITNLDVTGSFAQLKTFMLGLENAARLVIVDNYRYSVTESEEGVKIGINFVLISPYLYVESNAITDDPIDLNIGDGDFLDLINKIKSLRYYDPYEIDLTIPVVEIPAEGEEAAEGGVVEELSGPVEEGAGTGGEAVPEIPVEEGSAGEGGDSIFPQ